MGRPKELTEEDRARLRAEGYKPVEIWVRDLWSDDFWKQIDEECRLIRESDQRSDMNRVLEAFIDDNWEEMT